LLEHRVAPFRLLVGHSKGALQINKAIQSLPAKRTQGLRVVTLGCPIGENVGGVDYHQYLGLFDALGQLNAWGHWPDYWPPIWHSTVQAAAGAGTGAAAEPDMGDEEKLRRALIAHIEQKTDELWKSIDDLQKALEAVPTPEQAGEEDLSKRFIELMKRLGDVRHQFQLGLAAIDESNVRTKH
jgi:hypothetical protein